MLPRLAELVNQSILVRTLALDETHPVVVKLINVENAGIWVEFPVKTNVEWVGRPSLPKTPLFFLPFAIIAWISSRIEGHALPETRFGLKE